MLRSILTSWRHLVIVCSVLQSAGFAVINPHLWNVRGIQPITTLICAFFFNPAITISWPDVSLWASRFDRAGFNYTCSILQRDIKSKAGLASLLLFGYYSPVHV